ncbi:MAG: hypothetical protein R6W76_08465 [Caldilinea sp.]
MSLPIQMEERSNKAFNPSQSAILAEIFRGTNPELVRGKDYTEPKEIVRTLADAQQRSAH